MCPKINNPLVPLKFDSVNSYFDAFPKEIRNILEMMRSTIKKATPEAEEIISYNMPAFKLKKVLVYYAANKNHIGFYPTPGPIAAFQKELENYKTSKGAIQFPLDKPLPLNLIEKIVKFRLHELSEKGK